MNILRALGLSLLLQTNVWAASPAPICLGGNTSLPINNNEVLQWKVSTANQFLSRAHIQGSLTRIYPDKNGHHHFEIQIGSASDDTIEVIYNEGFGAVPQVAVNDTVEACGDYITSIAPAGPYPASPDGAIIHWIHESPNPVKHPSGYLMINNVVYGQGHP